MAPLKLNIGGGSNGDLPGYVNIDRKVGREAYPLDYPSGSVDEIRASHILEHFSHRQCVAVLREWVRVLKPGGIIKLAVPDFKWIAENYLKGVEFPVMGYVYGGHEDNNDVHLSGYDEECLTELMKMCGLTDIQRWTSELHDCASLPVSLNLQGRKPLGKVDPPVPAGCRLGNEIMAVMSLPRLTFSANMFCATRALGQLGIQLCKTDGVFWGQCLERMILQYIDSHPYILTIDYDSVYTAQDVWKLWNTMQAHPEVDALCAVQIRREFDTALLTKAGADGNPVPSFPVAELANDIMELRTAHFGLTLLRSSAIKKMPRPMFHSRPAPDGSWDEGRIDDDSFFWLEWKRVGNTLYQANRVPIGHLELKIKWPTPDLRAAYQSVSDWDTNGKPREGILV